jgi:hypothetical protein
MLYALLFYNPPHTLIPEPEREAVIGRTLAEMGDWQRDLERAGAYRSGLRLAPVDAAASLRSQGGDVLVSDGPFAETKEILGGLVVIECGSFDEALAWARRCPIVRFGTVEVRPQWGASR